MFERLTDRARAVLVNGRLAAQACRHPSIEAPHLLAGILRTPDTKGCEALDLAGLRYLDVLTALRGTYEQAAEEAHAPPVLSAQAKQLLDGALLEAVAQGHQFIETVHLALACTRSDRPPSIKPFVAGREHAIRAAALSAQNRSARLEADLGARRRAARLDADRGARRRSPPPERSLESRMDALQRANLVRTRRAQLKRDLKAGRVSIDELLLAPPDYVQTARVFDLLLAVPSYGRVKVNRLLAQCRISPSKTIGGLSERQRDELVALL